MAYDKAEYARIDAMELGDLVQYMVSHYEHIHPDYEGSKEAHMQSNNYFHAYERLNEIGKKLGVNNATPDYCG